MLEYIFIGLIIAILHDIKFKTSKKIWNYSIDSYLYNSTLLLGWVIGSTIIVLLWPATLIKIIFKKTNNN